MAASFEPGVSASGVAREVGLHVSQLFRWRKLLCERVVSRSGRTGASSPSTRVSSAGIRPCSIPGTTWPCSPANPARSGTAHRSRTGCCPPPSTGSGASSPAVPGGP